MNVVRWQPRGIGSNGGWASAVTGKEVDFGPDCAGFCENRSEAYKFVDMLNRARMAHLYPEHTERPRDQIDLADVCYRAYEPGWLQVKLIVDKEHEPLLERFVTAASMRDGYIDDKLCEWAFNLERLDEPYAIRCENYYRKLMVDNGIKDR